MALFSSVKALTEYASFHMLSLVRDEMTVIRGVIISLEIERQLLRRHLESLDDKRRDLLEKQRKQFEKKREIELKQAREREERFAEEINSYTQELLNAILEERPEPEWKSDLPLSHEARERARDVAARTANSAMMKLR